MSPLQDSQGRIGPLVGRLRMPVPRAHTCGDCANYTGSPGHPHASTEGCQEWRRRAKPPETAPGTTKEGEGA